MRSETQISEQLDERLTMNDNKRYLLLIDKHYENYKLFIYIGGAAVSRGP